MRRLVYKIVRRREWNAAKDAGIFTGSKDDLRDGFIHLSAAHQVRATCDRHFAGEKDLLLAAIEADRLGAELRWEVSRGGDTFPHLYGALPLSLVRSVTEIRQGADGCSIFPPEIP